MVPSFVPSDESLYRPMMRHLDLSPSNVFISEQGTITGLIDWQHCVIMPAFLHAHIPKHFQSWGDDNSERLQPPALPVNYDSMTAPEKNVEDEKFRRRQLHFFYDGFTGRHNKNHSKILRDSSIIEINRLFEIAGYPWEGDNASLKAEMIHYSRSRSLPTKYTEAEEQRALDLDDQQKDSTATMETFRDHIGCNIEDWVPTEDYESAMERVANLKAQILANAEMDGTKSSSNRTGLSKTTRRLIK